MTTEEITKYIFLEDNDLAGDIALVFGTWNSWRGSTEKAAELYKKKLVPKIIVSGGVNRSNSIVEGDFMAKELYGLDVARGDVLIEDKAANTLENVLFSRNVIDRVLGLGTIKVITAVVKNFHARRALMTLKKNMPDHIRFKVAPYTSPFYSFTKDNWFESGLGREKVFGEIEKIKKYLSNGSLSEIQ